MKKFFLKSCQSILVLFIFFIKFAFLADMKKLENRITAV